MSAVGTKNQSSGVSPTTATAGALTACCTVHLLVIARAAGSLGGLAVGGIAAAAGITVAAMVWLVAVLLRRRTRARARSVGWVAQNPPVGR